MTTFAELFQDDEFLNKAKDLLNAISASQGKLTVPMIGENIPHPTWVLEQIINLKNEMIRLNHREYMMLSVMRGLLAAMDQPDAEFPQKTFKEESLKELTSIIDAMRKNAQVNAADALKSKLVLPPGASNGSTGVGLALPPK